VRERNKTTTEYKPTWNYRSGWPKTLIITSMAMVYHRRYGRGRRYGDWQCDGAPVIGQRWTDQLSITSWPWRQHSHWPTPHSRAVV